MKNWYNTLSPRERNLVFYGSILATLMILGLFVVQPLLDKNKKLNNAISSKKNIVKDNAKTELASKATSATKHQT